MKNKSIIKLLLLGTVTGLSVSCTDNFLDYNTNPYEPTNLDPDGYGVSSALKMMESAVLPLDVNTFQFTDCLLGGTWGGYLADSNNGFNNRSFAIYSPQDDWVEPLMKQTMSATFPNITTIQALTDNEVLLSVANVIKVIAMQRVTDTYGPIPYSEVGKDGNITAVYDTQKKVYEKMFQEVDAAIEVLSKNRTNNFTPKADIVFGGKTEKWAKLANSLKLRMAVRIANVEPELAKQKAEEVMKNEIGPMSSNDDNAFITVTNNPLYVVMYEYNKGDSHIGADITSYMNGYEDPRREKYFTLSTFKNVTNGFIGLRSGVELPAGETIKQYTNINIKVDSKMMWMNAAETAFLRAEGALRGWSMGGTAESLYNQGIALSFGQWGAEGAETYAQDATKTPAVHKDPVNSSFSYNGMTSTITVKWDETADFEKNLERIITQKWIANFPLGLEAWAEYRRTGYPKLMEVVMNGSNGKVESSRMARRLNYPEVEYKENGENLKKALTDYLKGPDTMGTDVWWAKKNN
ncbi:MAG: SusD/RagB family nutrient-binding outer membrane lipoprotein [Bacteroidia bacterium]|nr:SusD/RagB family nutrient-binding outer membrane lipoprotein [Bacteroidia bacterium]